MKKILATATLAAGLFVGAAAYASDTGFQFSVIGNNFPEASDVDGVRIALFYGKTDTVKGFNTAIFGLSEVDVMHGAEIDFFGVNIINKEAAGYTASIANIHSGKQNGFTGGIVNLNDELNGAAVGIYNQAQDLKGVQIGFINVARNGFLPVFPFFNFGTHQKWWGE